jgi:large repetitive protein
LQIGQTVKWGKTVRTIDLTDINEAATNLSLSTSSITKNAVGAIVGTITVTDPDTATAFRNNSITVSDDRFEAISKNGTWQLKLKAGQFLNAQTPDTLPITLTATDGTLT